ncbi:hypothetical protein SOVF_159830, partial [Spinacia oleracea]
REAKKTTRNNQQRQPLPPASLQQHHTHNIAEEHPNIAEQLPNIIGNIPSSTDLQQQLCSHQRQQLICATPTSGHNVAPEK